MGELIMYLIYGVYRIARRIEEQPVIERQRRQENGLCEECGYDLRTRPKRCPECGHFVSATSRMFLDVIARRG